MLSARNPDGYVLASQVTKEDGPFVCPMCKGLVLVKKGRVKIHHFSHIPPTNCTYGTGESEAHMQAKLDIYETLQHCSDVSKLRLERPLGDVRPDISFYLKNVPIAIEVQISKLSLDTIDRRTVAYKNKGISLLWTSPYDVSIEYLKMYSPALWEKYLHMLYFGKLYYWISGEVLQPVRFDAYQLHVEYREWYIPDGGGDMDSAGGYDRYSKRYKTPRLLDRINITSLTSVNRKAWESKKLSTPEARLWCEPFARKE